MRTIGLIGGMSWESTAVYYRLINEMIRDALGGLHSAKILLWSFDFAEIVALQSAGDWQGAAGRLIDAGHALKAGGAQALVICTNTMHKVAAEVEKEVGLPLLHIADATAAAIKASQMKRVGLLATRFTMEHDFYREYLKQKHGIDIIVPDESERAAIHNIIFQELCKGVLHPASKTRYLEIIDSLERQGAKGIILGCTEIGMLLNQSDVRLPLFDSTYLHAQMVSEFLLGEENSSQTLESAAVHRAGIADHK